MEGGSPALARGPHEASPAPGALEVVRTGQQQVLPPRQEPQACRCLALELHVQEWGEPEGSYHQKTLPPPPISSLGLDAASIS